VTLVPPGEEVVRKVVRIVPVEGMVRGKPVPVPRRPVPVPLMLAVLFPGTLSRWTLFFGFVSR
jgi:hypothetical protein